MFEDLSRPCDFCGKPIGGGFHKCPKCKIYFCSFCGIEMIYKNLKYPIECPMCGEKLE